MALSFVERAAKDRKEEAKEAAGPEMKHKETLKEILANEKNSDLFGEYLIQELGTDQGLEIGRKLHTGELTPAEADELTDHRNTFLEILERSDNVIESLNEQSLQELIDSSPDLQRIAARNGAKGIRAVIKSQLPKIAITDRARFETLSDYATAIAERQANGEGLDDEIEAEFEQFGLSPSEIADLLQGGDSKEIAKRIGKKMGMFRKLFGGGSVAKIQARLKSIASQKSREIADHLDELEADQKVLGDALGLAFVENETLHAGLLTDLRSENIEAAEKGLSFADASKGMKLDAEAIKAAYKKKMEAYRDGRKEDIFNYHLEEWRAEQRAAEWDKYLTEHLKKLCEQKLRELMAREREEAESDYLQSQLDADPSADIPTLKKEFAAHYQVRTIEDSEREARFRGWEAEFTDDKRTKLRDNVFMKGYKNPPTPDDLKEEWEGLAIEASAPENDQFGEYEALKEDLAHEYNASRTKKKGLWATVMSEMNRNGIFNILG